MISNREIEEILEQDREATPGRWETFDSGPWGGQGVGVKTDDNVEHWFVLGKRTQEPHITNATLIANYRNQMRRVVERLRKCEEALKWYGNAMNYTAVARYSDNAYACPIADDDGTRARAYFSEVDGGEGG